MTRTPHTTTTGPGAAGRPTTGRPGRRLTARAAAVLAAAALAATAAAPARATPFGAATTRVSTGTAGAQPNDFSWGNALSAEGRYAVFSSAASNLVPGDTNGRIDVFTRDRWTGRTERVSLTEAGGQADGASYDGAISGDGRYVVFTSTAALVAGDTNGAEDVYVRDRWTGRTERLTTGDPGREQPGLDSYLPSVSRDGRYVAFASTRTDLLPGERVAMANVYVTDRWTGTTRLATVGADGSPANRPSADPQISADGSAVGFVSKATNLLPPAGGGPAEEARPSAESLAAGAEDAGFEHRSGVPARSGGPRAAAGERATLLKPRLHPFFVHEVATGRTRGASTDEAGELVGVADASVGPDGRYAVYALPVVNRGPDGELGGRHFELFVRDLRSGGVRHLAAALPGTTSNGSFSSPRLALGNRWLFFVSAAENLVAGDTNQADDVFRHDLWTGRTERVSVASDGAQNTGASYGPVLDALGTTVLFGAEDGTLVEQDSNGAADVFARRLPPF
ncbi:TolB family protein [Kitasatospora sp. NPDC127111]|uniref:TolB family protein n=1 Tax=Kitasatospora sp. NPDC127111 TaxID=3345363 RepID=UPI00362E8C4F